MPVCVRPRATPGRCRCPSVLTRPSPACALQEQASWVCQCEEGVVQRLEQDFKLTLQQQSSLDQWASWLDNVVKIGRASCRERVSSPV